MFTYTIDKKPKITDPFGNEIVDLAASIYTKSATSPMSYDMRKVTKTFNMRPDMVAISEYGDMSMTEFVLKYSSVSNPFSFGEDTVLMMVSFDNIKGMLASENTTSSEVNSAKSALIKKYFKYVNQTYNDDTTSYDQLENLKIPSANIDLNEAENYKIPYINYGDNNDITIKNGRIYFGTNVNSDDSDPFGGNTSVEQLTNKIQNLINQSTAKLSTENCLYSGTSTSDVNRAIYKADNAS